MKRRLQAMMAAVAMLVTWGSMASGAVAQGGSEKATRERPAAAAKEKPSRAADEKKADAAKAKPKDNVKAAPGQSLRGYYAIMASETAMTDEQRDKLAAIVTQRQTAVKAYEQDNQEAIKSLGDEVKAARAAGDKAKVEAAAAKLKPIMAGKQKLYEQYNGQMVGLMDPVQKQQWKAYQIFHRLSTSLAKADMTDEQKLLVRAKAADVAPSWDNDLDPAEDRKRFLAVRQDVVDQVLTDEQREALKGKSSMASDRAKPEKPNRNTRPMPLEAAGADEMPTLDGAAIVDDRPE